MRPLFKEASTKEDTTMRELATVQEVYALKPIPEADFI
jgi:hypothetical protein